MISCRCVNWVELYQVCSSERAFAVGATSSQFFTSTQGACNDVVSSKRTNAGEEGFKLVADSGEVGVDRFWANIVAHVDRIKT